MDNMPRRQRITIAIQAVQLAATLVFFVYAYQANRILEADNRVIHAENDISKTQRAENRDAIRALAARVERMDAGGGSMAERIARLEKTIRDASPKE